MIKLGTCPKKKAGPQKQQRELRLWKWKQENQMLPKLGSGANNGGYHPSSFT